MPSDALYRLFSLFVSPASRGIARNAWREASALYLNDVFLICPLLLVCALFLFWFVGYFYAIRKPADALNVDLFWRLFAAVVGGGVFLFSMTDGLMRFRPSAIAGLQMNMILLNFIVWSLCLAALFLFIFYLITFFLSWGKMKYAVPGNRLWYKDEF